MRALVAEGDGRHRFLLSAGGLTFLALGAIQAMYGPAFPGLRERFGLGLESVSDVVTLHFAGAFVTIAASSVLLRRFGYRPVLVAGALAFTVGAAAVAFSPGWTLVRAGALLGGIGFGLLDVGANLLFARLFAPNAAPALNLMNAAFGLGAMGGPVLVGAFAASVLVPFATLSLLGATVAWALARVPEPVVPRAAGAREGAQPWAAAGFLLLYFFYVASEVGVATWEPTHLAPVLGVSGAAYVTSAYWGGVTVGRLLATSVSARLRPADLVTGAVGLALLGLVAAHWLPLAPYAYVLVGLAFAPVFPTGLAWLQRVYPQRSERIAPLVVAAATAGPLLTSRPLGALLERGGPAWVPSLLALLVGATLLCALLLWRATRRR